MWSKCLAANFFIILSIYAIPPNLFSHLCYSEIGVASRSIPATENFFKKLTDKFYSSAYLCERYLVAHK